MKRILCLLLVVLLVLGGLSGCGKKEPETKTNPDGSKTTGGEQGLPEVTITGDKVVICGGPANVQDWMDQLKEVYQLDAEYIEVPYNDYTTRFATLVLSGDSPDVGFYRPDRSDFPRYIVNNLVQDAGQYVDLSDPFYDSVRYMLDASEYQGKHYMMPYTVQARQGFVYNDKLFRDAGLESPWELYLKNEWTMDKLEEYAIELTEYGADGIPTRYGFGLDRAFGLIYTAGHTLGSYDPKTCSIINNRNDKQVAATVNRVAKWVTEKKITPPRVDGLIEWFDTDRIAMVFVEGDFLSEPVYKLARDGNLGLCPMARDASVDTYYARGRFDSWWLVEGAKNPGGAIAFWNVSVLDNTREVTKFTESLIKIAADNGYTEQNLEQLRTILDKKKVVPVMDLTPWMDGGALWMTFQKASTWEVQLAAYEASVQDTIDSLFKPLEEDLPLSPKTIADFEKDGAKDGDTVSEFVVKTEGGQNIQATLNAANAQGGSRFAMQVKYDVSDKGWGGIYYSFNKTLESNDSLRFWIKGDGTTQTVKFTLSNPTGYSGVYEYKLEGKDGKIVTIPFDSFTVSESSTADEMNLTKISDVGIYVETKGAHTFWIDNLEGYNSSKAS